MTKLLHRLTDRSREEVSNQAIVLVQQLTSRNEEMKKTVVFNEVSKTFVDFPIGTCLFLQYLFKLSYCYDLFLSHKKLFYFFAY